VRAQAGDRQALEQVLTDIAPPLRGYLARIAGNRTLLRALQAGR
jgi:hypothetical protein